MINCGVAKNSTAEIRHSTHAIRLDTDVYSLFPPFFCKSKTGSCY